MVALMCGCCRKPDINYYPGPYVGFNFHSEIDMFDGEIMQYRFENSITLYRKSQGIFNEIYSNQCNMDAKTGKKLSPSVDDPDNGDWTEGFFVRENGNFYKTQDIPTIDNALSLIRPLLPIDSSFRYALFDKFQTGWTLEPILFDSSLDIVYSAFLASVRSSYSECASKFGSADCVRRGYFVIYHPEGSYADF